MYVHSAIAALRADPALQRRSQAVIEASLSDWRVHPDVAVIEYDLERYSWNEDLKALTALGRLMADFGHADAFAKRFIGHLCEALRTEPLGQVPLRQGSNPGFSQLQLMQSRGATLSLCTYEPVARISEPHSARFTDVEIRELVLSGSARVIRHSLSKTQAPETEISSESQYWSAGQRSECDPLLEARDIVAVEQSLLILQLTRKPNRARPTCVYRLADGALTQQASGNKRASEHVMALAVLGALGEHRSLDQMVVFALNQTCDPNARWEAVRQTLSINSMRGMRLLRTLERRSDDLLSTPSRQLRTSLINAHPDLEAAEEVRA